MLRKRLPLSLAAGRLAAQVLTCVVATLIGSTVSSLLQKRPGSAKPPAIELTSGGKFAARVPNLAETEPLPADDRVADADAASPSLAPSIVPLLSAASAPAALMTEGVAALEKPLRSRSHPLRAAGLRRSADAPLPVARRSLLPVVDAGQTGSDDGLLSKALASARALWSFSAAAGSALLSRVVP